MKHALFIVRTPPHGSAAIPESVRLCLGFGTMPFEISYLLMDDGVWAAMPTQKPEAIGGRDTLQMIQNLAELDVNLFAEASALSERGLEVDGLEPEIRPLSQEEISDLIARADLVLTY